ncbi:MAG TPA: SCO family protein [Caulobacteraceae bacterium]|nr:SCO family protein [Caulobacteraceae bacterium]
MNRLPVIVATLCLAAAALIAGATWWVTRNGPSGAAGSAQVISSGKALVGGPFQLVDQTGRAVDESILKGKWTVVFFGFTFCPDVCPTTLTAMEAVKKDLGARGADLQVVFITVDPERDTPAALKAYLDSVGPEGTIGLTGTPEQVTAAAKAYRVYFRKSGEGDDYTMDHSTAAYLMDPKGEFAAVLPYGLAPADKAKVIRDAMKQ